MKKAKKSSFPGQAPQRAAGLAIVALCLGVAAPAAAADVPRWEPRDFSFSSRTEASNPFQVAFSAVVQAPDGTSFTMPGFYDGQGVWKVRIAPTVEGLWSLTTCSDVPELNGQRVDFTCVRNTNPKVHGRLRVDPEHPHHFIFDDGARFFLQGYEFDWLWALDAGKPDTPVLDNVLDLIAGYGFNYVILNSYAHDAADWRKGKSGTDDFGPPPLFPWEGTNTEPDHSRMNPAYWRHYDRVIEALHRRGMQAHVLLKVYNKDVNWPERGGAEEDQFFRWIIARYAAYPNIVWDFSKEAHNEKNLSYKQSRLQFLRENDPYRHLITVHDDDVANDGGAYDAWTDYRSDQQHSDWHAVVLRQAARRDWPVVNVEFGYEHGPGGIEDKTYAVAQPPEEVVRRAWEIALAGGYTAYYYTYTAWDVIRPADEPPGYAYFKHFGDFFRRTEYWLLRPADELVSEGWCLANPGEYVAFLNEAKPLTIQIDQAAAPLQAEWFNPHTGRRIPAGQLGNGTARLVPPADWGKAPLVLHVRAKRAGDSATKQETGPKAEPATVFPGRDWIEATPESQGVDSARLTEALDYLKGRAGGDGIREVAVMRHGRLIWRGDDIDKVHGVWSCTKSFTSTVLGLLIDDGKCSLDTLAADLVPAMAAAYPAVTLRHFTTMTSGYRAEGDEPQGTYLHGPSATPFVPSDRPLFTPPGTQYAYWDSAMNQFALVLTKIAGEPLEKVFKDRIADPIGMDPAQWRWGTYAIVDGVAVNGGSGNADKHVQISARQMARFGLLMLHRGNWNGRQLLSRSWIAAATSVQVPAATPWAQPASEIDGRGVYGFNWWVNGTRANGRRKWPDVPADTFGASGYNNNKMFVIPAWDMVIVRLGLDAKDGKIGDDIWGEFLLRVGKAVQGETEKL